MTAAAAAVTTREDRRRELARLTKAQLVKLYRPRCLYSAHPLETWRKDELISSLLSLEFPEAEGTDHR